MLIFMTVVCIALSIALSIALHKICTSENEIHFIMGFGITFMGLIASCIMSAMMILMCITQYLH